MPGLCIRNVVVGRSTPAACWLEARTLHAGRLWSMIQACMTKNSDLNRKKRKFISQTRLSASTCVALPCRWRGSLAGPLVTGRVVRRSHQQTLRDETGEPHLTTSALDPR